MTRASGLLRGSAMLSFSRILGAGTSQLLYWVMASASMADLGVFRTVMTYFLASEALALLGMNQYLIREVAKDERQIWACLRNAVILCVPVTLLGGAALGLLAHSGGYGADISRGLYWVIASLPASAAVLIAQSLLIGRERGATMGLLQSGETCVRAFACIALIQAGYGVEGTLPALALVRWLFAAGYILAMRSLLSQAEAAQGSERTAGGAFRDFTAQLPTFAGITLLYIVFRFTGQALVALLRGDVEAGVFAVGYQVLDLAMLVPTAVAMNFMPVLARQSASREGLVRVCGRMLALASFAVLPCAILAGRVADPLVHLVFPKAWPAAVTPVQCMLWASYFLCLDQALSVLLVASGRQAADMRSLAAGTAAMAAFIPPGAYFYGAQGAAGAFVCVTVVLVCVRLRFTGDLAQELLRAGRMPLALSGGAAMCALVWLIPDGMVAVIAGSALYAAGAALFLFKRRSHREGHVDGEQT